MYTKQNLKLLVSSQCPATVPLLSRHCPETALPLSKGVQLFDSSHAVAVASLGSCCCSMLAIQASDVICFVHVSPHSIRTGFRL